MNLETSIPDRYSFGKDYRTVRYCNLSRFYLLNLSDIVTGKTTKGFYSLSGGI